MKREIVLFLTVIVLFSYWSLVASGQAADSNQTQAQLTNEDVTRGKQIYEHGTSSSGSKISAYLPPPDNMVVPGNIMECATCHGHDGHGKPVGTVTPTDLNWAALTRSGDITHPDGRKHPPYTESLLKKAITEGVDPAGNKLSNVMPHYRMSPEDLDDLVLYLKRLGSDRGQESN